MAVCECAGDVERGIGVPACSLCAEHGYAYALSEYAAFLLYLISILFIGTGCGESILLSWCASC